MLNLLTGTTQTPIMGKEIKDEPQDNFEEDEIEFNPCDNCDCLDACREFGCAIQSGVRRPVEF